MQMLFQADVGKQTPEQVSATFWKAGDDVEPEVRGFAEDLFRVATIHQEKIDELIVANSKNWRLERMPAVDRNLLRMAVGEMLGFKSTPFPIVINKLSRSAVATLRLNPSTFLTDCSTPSRTASCQNKLLFLSRLIFRRESVLTTYSLTEASNAPGAC